MTSTIFDILILTQNHENVISKGEVENIIEYVWDKGLRGVKNNRLMEELFLGCKLPESSIARLEKLNLSLLCCMH